MRGDSIYKPNRAKFLLIMLGSMMMVDYFLTWYGVNILGFIEESNPIIAWSFEINFIASFAVRVLMVSSLLLVFYKVFEGSYRNFKLILSFGIIINSVILLSHARWIYLMYEYI